MARKVTTPESFKFLKPEEIDLIIRNRVEIANKANPWTEAELTMRNQVIIDLIGQGLSRRRIVEEMMSRWGICYATANDYLKQAYDVLMKGNEEFVAYNKEKQVERLETIITDAQMAGDFKAAVNAVAELNKLLGLTTTQKVTLDVDRTFKFGGE